MLVEGVHSGTGLRTALNKSDLAGSAGYQRVEKGEAQMRFADQASRVLLTIHHLTVYIMAPHQLEVLMAPKISLATASRSGASWPALSDCRPGCTTLRCGILREAAAANLPFEG